MRHVAKAVVAELIHGVEPAHARQPVQRAIQSAQVVLTLGLDVCARQMLQQTSTSIVQIGLSCGFSSGPHFSSAYRNFFGVTPREDRNLSRAAAAGEMLAAADERG